LKPHVLQLIQSFDQGGSERQMVQLTRLLSVSGRYRVFVACLNAGGVLRPEIESIGLGEIPEYPLNSFYDRNMLRQLRRFREFLKQNQISMVHTHDFYSNIFGMAAAQISGVPARLASRRETGGMRTPAQKKAERWSFRLAHGIVANAEAVRAQLVTEGVPSDKITVLYNGLDLDRLAPRSTSLSEALSLVGVPPALSPPLRKLVTLVANLRHDVKDYPMFLRAAGRIHAAIPEAAFLMAGEGMLIEPMRALAAELGIAESAFFLGRCENVPDLLRISDVCVLSSSAEGFSNAILEYMAAGKPVVATDVGGAREAIVEGETGYLVPSGDDSAMANQISSLLRNPEQAKAMGEAGRRVVAEKFSTTAQLQKVEELYARLLSQRIGKSSNDE
jgi:glycosyltransferase involved in cell wall biosynthesis